MLSEEALLFVLFNYGVFYFVMKRWMDVVFSVLFFGVFERSMIDGCCFFIWDLIMNLMFSDLLKYGVLFSA